MRGFLYYVAGRQGDLSLEAIGELGVGYAVERSVSHRGAVKGPDGGAGIVFADGGLESSEVGHYPDRQVWRRIPGLEAEVWVGYCTEDPPGPEDLARSSGLSGHPVLLGDGQEWIVPAARRWTEDLGAWYCALPAVRELNNEGVWENGAVRKQYARLWEIATGYWDLYTAAAEDHDGEAESVTIPFDDENDAATEVLGVNYRVGRMEASLLTLWDAETVTSLLGALVDLPSLDAFLKKK